MDLFDFAQTDKKSTVPLAERMRPKTLADFYGQEHIIFPGSLLTRAIKADRLGNCIFWGPPGTGKTTLASIIANTTNSDFVRLNAVSSGVADAKKVIEEAREKLRVFGKKTYLLLDECHRWNKAQSDCVLSAMEDGSIIFVGSTTENPNLAMTRAIVSRCRVFELKALKEADIKKGVLKALGDSENGLGNYDISLSDDALDYIAWSSSGDMRKALGALELAALSTPPDENGRIIIDKKTAEQSVQRKSVSINESTSYDMLSAFCKSLRGSDADAALYWGFRLVESGFDPLILFRRMIAHSSEDVGMADSSVLQFIVSAMNAYEKIGMPEGELTLAHAIIYICTAPKSNRVYLAKEAAKKAIETIGDDYVPLHLRNTDFSTSDKSDKPYLYPHDFGGYVTQQYLPDGVAGKKFYRPGDNGKEKQIKEFMAYVKQRESEAAERDGDNKK